MKIIFCHLIKYSFYLVSWHDSNKLKQFQRCGTHSCIACDVVCNRVRIYWKHCKSPFSLWKSNYICIWLFCGAVICVRSIIFKLPSLWLQHFPLLHGGNEVADKRKSGCCLGLADQSRQRNICKMTTELFIIWAQVWWVNKEIILSWHSVSLFCLFI